MLPLGRDEENSASLLRVPEALLAVQAEQPDFECAPSPVADSPVEGMLNKQKPPGEPFNRLEELESLNRELMTSNIELRQANHELNCVAGELRQEKRHLAKLLTSCAGTREGEKMGSMLIDPQSRIRAFTPGCTTYLNLLPQDVGQPADRLTRALPEGDALLDGIRSAVDNGIPVMRESRCDTGVRFLTQIIPRHDRSGQLEVVALFFSKISTLNGEQERNRILARVFEEIQEALLVTDPAGRVIASNDSFSRLSGYTHEELRGQGSGDLSTGLKSEELATVLENTSRSGKSWLGEVIIRSRDGTVHPSQLNVTHLRDERQEIIASLVSFRDITEQKVAERLNEYQANHDALTGLFNRFGLMQRLPQSLEQARRDNHRLAVLFIDLDHFKEVNDSVGHHIGDLLLVEVAARLVATVRVSDIVARLGGDEFVAVMPHVNSAIGPAYLADKIRRAISIPFLLEGHEIATTPSIGISVFPDDGGSVEELLKSADTAMYHAKSQGRNNCRFFTQEMHTLARERLLLEHDLRLAVERNEFILHFQPQIDLTTGLVIGVKAMLRWRHPLRGIITPDKFISTADASGLILRIDHLSLEMACRQLAAWTAEGVPRVTMAIRLSARQFRQKTLAEKVAAIISVTGVNPRLLDLEVTESATMGNPDETIRQLERLSRLGLNLSIDNFGAGYSSLSYVRRFPVNRLIIDRSFVQGIKSNDGDAAIMTATISLAHSIGKQIAAKGIETEAQLTLLAAQGCDVGQGYLFSRPLAADRIVDFIRRHADRPVVDLSAPPGIVAAPFLAGSEPTTFSSGE
jgi:diguanylate cyclase (GGDEF)-like protein/PAS domain S-box-containing protein